MAATPVQLHSGKALFSGVPAVVQYVADLMEQAPDIIATAVNKALEEEVEWVRDRGKYTEHASVIETFDIRAEDNSFVYGFTSPHGLRDPSTGRWMSWKALEYGRAGLPATGFLRSAVANRERQLGTRITQLITEELR